MTLLHETWFSVFTNTRMSNYAPGDIFKPLDALLSQPRLQLARQTTYCVDSEGFNYLAALNSGVAVSRQAEYDRSWKHSRDDAMRLLAQLKSIPLIALRTR